jgi:signal transduction histidine kinase
MATLEILARDFSATARASTVHCDLEPVKLEANAELVIYRLVQEASPTSPSTPAPSRCGSGSSRTMAR